MLPPDFPVGEYVAELPIGAARRGELIGEIEELPGRLRVLVGGMDETQRDRRYRKWTVRQIVHHIADSHVNAYVRFKLALTEEVPTIKPYDEGRWAALADSLAGDVELPLALLEALHRRWALLLRSLTPEQLGRRYFHPE